MYYKKLYSELLQAFYTEKIIKCGAVRLRARRRKYRPLPSIVFGNAQSIRNKTEELEATVKFYHEFRDANLMCLSETWLTENDGDTEIPGFTVVRGDRSLDETGKRRGGGVCVCT